MKRSAAQKRKGRKKKSHKANVSLSAQSEERNVERMPSPSRKSSTELRSSVSAQMPTRQFKVFCDLDGVLVDFAAGVERVTGARPEQISKSRMWRALSKEKEFYSNLPWMKDGKKLWDAIRPLGPDILTGVPMNECSRTEKATWCMRELGVETNHVDAAGPRDSHKVVAGRKRKNVTNVITCWSRNKHVESRTGA